MVPISKRECEKTIRDLRILFGIEDFRVIAYAELKIEEEEEELVAVSGHTTPTGTIDLPHTPLFSPSVIGFPRDADAEYKLLEEIGRRLLSRGSAVKATIRIGIEEKPCESCEAVINEFRVMFPPPDIELVVTHL